MVINKKYRYIFYFCLWGFCLTDNAISLNIELPLQDVTLPYSDYGKILSSQDLVKNGIKHKIEIYPVKGADSSERITRDGSLVCYKNAKANVLICHGFMGNHHDIGLIRGLFPEGDYNFMTFDFRAHGNKDRAVDQFCTFGRDEVFDVLAAVRFLQSHPVTMGKPIVGVGYSMGASSLILTEKQEKVFHSLILDCPFDTSQNIMQRALEAVQPSFLGFKFNIPGKQLLQEYVFHPYMQYIIKPFLRAFSQLDPRDINTYVCQVSPKDAVKEVTIPCLFIICKKDARVPVDAMKTIFGNAGAQYKKLWITNGRWHCDSVFYNPEKYKEMLMEFLDDLFDRRMLHNAHQKVYEDPQEM